MSKALRYRRILRILRRVPARTFRDWRKAFVTEDKLLSLCLAILTSYIGLRSAALPRVIEGLTAWGDAIVASSYVSIGWFAVCLVRAPIALHFEEQQMGSWHGNRYAFHLPHLLGAFRVKPTGAPEFFNLDTSFLESDAFIYFRIETDREIPKTLYTANVVCNVLLSEDLKPGSGCIQGGTRLESGVPPKLIVVMEPNAVAISFRVYCTDFAIGNPDDRDGAVGNANPDWILDRYPRRDC